MHRSTAYLVCATCLFVLSPARAGAQQNVVYLRERSSTARWTSPTCLRGPSPLVIRFFATLTTVQEFGRIGHFREAAICKAT